MAQTLIILPTNDYYCLDPHVVTQEASCAYLQKCFQLLFLIVKDVCGFDQEGKIDFHQ